MSRLKDGILKSREIRIIKQQTLITSLQDVLIETKRLLENGAKGAIVDTVWSDTTPNTTLFELIEVTLYGQSNDE